VLRKRLFRTALAVVVLGAAVVLPQTPAFAEVYGPYYLQEMLSGRCIADPNASTGNVTMIIWNCSGGGEQRWWNDDAPGGTNRYWIKNQTSGKCLTVQNASMSDNVPIIQYACNSGANEIWRYNRFDDLTYFVTINGVLLSAYRYQIQNVNSGLCITVKNASMANGSTLLQYTCNSPGSNSFLEVFI
jgi:hypothetical protein